MEHFGVDVCGNPSPYLSMYSTSCGIQPDDRASQRSARGACKGEIAEIDADEQKHAKIVAKRREDGDDFVWDPDSQESLEIVEEGDHWNAQGDRENVKEPLAACPGRKRKEPAPESNEDPFFVPKTKSGTVCLSNADYLDWGDLLALKRMAFPSPNALGTIVFMPSVPAPQIAPCLVDAPPATTP
eukprot:gene25316-10972_t